MSLGGLVSLLIWLLVFGLVIWLIWWAGGAIISLLPPPIQPPARVVLIVLIALVCIGALLNFVGGIGVYPHLPNLSM